MLAPSTRKKTRAWITAEIIYLQYSADHSHWLWTTQPEKANRNHTSLTVKPTQSQNVRKSYTVFICGLWVKAFTHSEMYVLFQNVYCVWTGILHEAAGQPGQRLPRLPHQQKGPTETPCSYWWHWPTKEINSSRPPRQKAWSQWISATATELSVCCTVFHSWHTFAVSVHFCVNVSDSWSCCMKRSLMLVSVNIGSVNILKTNA